MVKKLLQNRRYILALKSFLKKTLAGCLTVFTVSMSPMFTMADNVNATDVNAGVSAALSSIISENTDNGEDASGESEYRFGYENLGVADVNDYVNIRESASEDAEMVGRLEKDAGCNVLKEKDGWYKIESGKVTGWVKGDYLLTGDAAYERAGEVAKKYATVNTTTLNVRKSASTDSSIIKQVGEGSKLVVVSEKKNGWVKVKVGGDKGYVSSDYVTVALELEDALTATEVKYGEGVSDVRSSLVSYALSFVGGRYVWGGATLGVGVDCSGFTMCIYARYGVSLPHSSSAQPNSGTRISLSEVQPGDLIFYGSGGISHVAIYIGGGQIVHAANARKGIIVSGMYYMTPVCAARYLS